MQKPIEKLDKFGCTIIHLEGNSTNVLNDKVAMDMFAKINELIDVVNKHDQVLEEIIKKIAPEIK